MTQDKKWQPKNGDQIKFMPKTCKRGDITFDDNDMELGEYKFTTKDGLHIGEHMDGTLLMAREIQPITKTIEDEIREIIPPEGGLRDSLVNRIMEVISRHNQPVMPSDDEIIEYWGNIRDTVRESLIATVKHFLTRKA